MSQPTIKDFKMSEDYGVQLIERRKIFRRTDGSLESVLKSYVVIDTEGKESKAYSYMKHAVNKYVDLYLESMRKQRAAQ